MGGTYKVAREGSRNMSTALEESGWGTGCISEMVFAARKSREMIMGRWSGVLGF